MWTRHRAASCLWGAWVAMAMAGHEPRRRSCRIRPWRRPSNTSVPRRRQLARMRPHSSIGRSRSHPRLRVTCLHHRVLGEFDQDQVRRPVTVRRQEVAQVGAPALAHAGELALTALLPRVGRMKKLMQWFGAWLGCVCVWLDLVLKGWLCAQYSKSARAEDFKLQQLRGIFAAFDENRDGVLTKECVWCLPPMWLSGVWCMPPMWLSVLLGA